MKNALRCLVLARSAFLLVGQASANPCPPGNPPTNCAPPPGAILDLNGTVIPHAYRNYTVDFIATLATTNLSFALREDPAFLLLDDVSMTDLTTPSGEPVVNGGFEAGLGPWVALNTFGATFAGTIGTAPAHGGTHEWFDGSVQGYDGLSQAIATTIGHTYHISFFLNDNGGLTTFSRLAPTATSPTQVATGSICLSMRAAFPRSLSPLRLRCWASASPGSALPAAAN